MTKTTYRIHFSTNYIKELFPKPATGSVHSVYRKTVNLIIGSQLVALQADGSPISPISMITSLGEAAMESLPITAGLSATLDSQAVTIFCKNGHRLLFVFPESETLFFNTALSPFCSAHAASQPITHPLIFHGLQLARAVLDATPPSGFARLFQDISFPGDDLTLAAADRHIRQAISFCRHTDWEPAAEELVGLLGLGIGLTPSGDDFLCGILAGMVGTGKSKLPLALHLHAKIHSHLQDTNDISRTFLECALHGQFSLAVLNFFRTAALGQLSQGDIHLVSEAFASIGHSSGMDTLCGILYTLEYV